MESRAGRDGISTGHTEGVQAHIVAALIRRLLPEMGLGLVHVVPLGLNIPDHRQPIGGSFFINWTLIFFSGVEPQPETITTAATIKNTRRFISPPSEMK